MKAIIRPEGWVSISLVISLASCSAAQAPQPQPDQPEFKGPALLRAKPLKEDPKDDELRRLLKARYNEVVGELQSQLGQYQVGRIGFGEFIGIGQRLLHAGLELHEKSAEKEELLKQYLDLTKAVEELTQAKLKAAQSSSIDLYRARYHRLDAEIALLRAKREAEKAKGK